MLKNTTLKDLLTKTLGCKIVYSLLLEMEHGTILPDLVKEKSTAEVIHLKTIYKDLFEENIYFEKTKNGIECVRKIKNISDQKQNLIKAGMTLKGISFKKDPKDDYFYHVENPRIYNKMAIPVDTIRTPNIVEDSEFDVLAGNQWIDANDACERIGFSPYQPFPAVLISNYKTKKGIVHGSLSQRFFYHNYLLTHENKEVTLNISASFKSLAYREVKPNEILEDSWYLGTTEHADNLEKIFEEYTEILKQHLPPLFGATDINRHSVVWGSWNDGIFFDIDEERLIKQAEFLAENFPTVGWMQIDSGYAEYAGKLKAPHGIGAPYEKNGGTDMNKFPENLAGFTEKVMEIGIKPAVWIGGNVPTETPLGHDKPEWFFDYSFRPGVANSKKKNSYLDVSKPEVREYMLKALDFLLLESGFRGMKHDFWSYAFEDSCVRLANKDQSGYELRSWWLNEIRKRLPDNGYFQTGCDIVMGNPFLAEYFTNYRYGIDIANGNWENILTNFLWGTACFALHIGDLFVPNSDSIGILPGLNDDEALFCINYCLISCSTAEAAGWLYQKPDHPRITWVKKALCCPNNGQNVFFADYDYRKESLGPDTWYLKSPHFSLIEGSNALPVRTFAVFNLHDDTREFVIDMQSLNLSNSEYTLTDVWTLESFDISEKLNLELKAHSSKLFSVNPKNEVKQILDANLKINAASSDNNSLIVDFAFAGDLEMVLNFKPEKVMFENDTINFKLMKGKGNWILSVILPESGYLQVI